MLRAAIYTRVSTQEQGQRGTSLDTQAADCRALAVQLGADVVAEWRDTDSGASWDLPGLMAMLDAARRRDFDVLLCWDTDRLARRMAKQLVLEEELARSRVTIRYVMLRTGDTPEDQLLKNVKSSIAEYERHKIALRTARGRREKAERGMVTGNGWAPYGYTFAFKDDSKGRPRVIGLVPHPGQARVIERIFSLAATESAIDICVALNRDGEPAYRGGHWSPTTVQDILRSRTYVGLWSYGKKPSREKGAKPRPVDEWITVPVPALVSVGAWEAAQRGKAERRTRRRKLDPDTPDTFLLRNRLVCAVCDGVLSCAPNRNGHRYYLCLRAQPYYARHQARISVPCTMPRVPADAVEALVWERITQALLNPDILRAKLSHSAAERAGAADRQRRQASVLDRDIERQRQRHRRNLDEQLDSEPGSERYARLREQEQDIATALARLEAERAELLAAPLPGLGVEELRTLSDFAAEMGERVLRAEPEDQALIYAALGLRVKVRHDPVYGVQLGRKRFSLTFDAVVSVAGKERQYENTRLMLRIPQAWEAAS